MAEFVELARVSAVVCISGFGCTVHGVIGSNYTADTGGSEGTGMGMPETDTEATSTIDATGTVQLDVPDPDGFPSYGEWWCALAVNAAYGPDPDPGADEPVVDSEGDPPEGCQCVPFNTDVHAWFLDHEVDDEVVIEQGALETELGAGDPLVDELLDVRDAVYLEARASCGDLVPLPNLGDNCSAPDLFDTDLGTPAFQPTPLHLAGC